jgi:hypothetical protein
MQSPVLTGGQLLVVSSFFGGCVVLCNGAAMQILWPRYIPTQRDDRFRCKVQSAVSATKPVSFGSTSKESDIAVSSHGRSTTDVLKPVRIAQVASVIVGKVKTHSRFTTVPFESQLHYRSRYFAFAFTLTNDDFPLRAPPSLLERNHCIRS